MQVQEKMAHFVMGGQSRVDIFQDLKYVALIHPCCSCMFLDVFSFVTSAGCLPLISVLVVGVQTMYQAECGTPSLYLFLCVFLCFFLFLIQVSLVLVVGHPGVQTMYQAQCGTPSLYSHSLPFDSSHLLGLILCRGRPGIIYKY